MIPFSYYSGAGNTFLLVDNREKVFPLQAAAHVCEKEGADGLLLLEKSSLADFCMRIFNRDGHEAEMCGNGLRCLIHYLDRQGCSLPLFRIETKSGIQMGCLKQETVYTRLPNPTSFRWNLSLDHGGKTHLLHHLNTGVPHTILFVESIDSVDVEGFGRFIRNHPLFAPEGTNMNFVALKQQGIEVRTYERGVENETLACGTGSAAAAIAANKLFHYPFPLKVFVRSGEALEISLEADGISISGPAKHVRDGQFSLTY